MAFSSDLAKLVGDQLSRFVTLNRHQLAGQVANLDFWLTQVRQALDVIDGYGVRFTRMHAAQEQHVTEHGTKEFNLNEKFPGPTKAAPARRVPDNELKAARQLLTKATHRFLLRCYDEGFIDEPRLQSICDSLGIELESGDVRRRGH